MTIVAVKDGVMACDTGVFSDGVFCGTARKWAMAKDGGFMAASGELGKAQAAMRILPNEPGGEAEPDVAIWLRFDGAVWEKYGDGEWLCCEADFYAIGSGEMIARGAMAAGASAEEAVRICIALCTECGGEVEVVGL